MNIVENLQVKNLADAPEFIPTIAQWTYDNWGKYDPTLSVESSIQDLQKNKLNRDKIPMVFVALHDNKLIASFTLKPSIKVKGFEDRDLWLGSFLVVPEQCGLGVGQFMLDQAYAKAKALGFKKISLFASDPKAAQYFADHGWVKFATAPFHAHEVTLLEYVLL